MKFSNLCFVTILNDSYLKLYKRTKTNSVIFFLFIDELAIAKEIVAKTQINNLIIITEMIMIFSLHFLFIFRLDFIALLPRQKLRLFKQNKMSFQVLINL